MFCVRSNKIPAQGISSLRSVTVALVLAIIAGALSAAPVRGIHQQEPPNASPGQTKNTSIQIEPGKTLELTLAGGETHTYEIRLETGQFLHAAVEQLGIDVALIFNGPDGKRIASMDSPNGAFGLEQISIIADVNGTYRLEIGSGDKSARAGRYRVSISPLRAPTDADRARISAERTFIEAVQQNNAGSADSLRRAAEKYEATLPLWRAAGDVYEEALALIGMGEIYTALGERRKGLDCLLWALPLWRSLGDREGEATTLNDMGQIHDALGERQKALEYLFSQLNGFQEAFPKSFSDRNQLGPDLDVVPFYLRDVPKIDDV